MDPRLCRDDKLSLDDKLGLFVIPAKAGIQIHYHINPASPDSLPRSILISTAFPTSLFFSLSK